MKIKFDDLRLEVSFLKRKVKLTKVEFLILKALDNPALASTRKDLDKLLPRLDCFSNRIDVHIKNLRKKIAPEIKIASIHGVGYELIKNA